MSATATREKPLPEGCLPITALSLGVSFTTTDGMGPLGFNDLAWFHRHPECAAREVIPCACSVCSAPLHAMRLFSELTACDDCRAKAIEDERMNACKSFWEAACPADLRATDVNHADFPKPLYLQLRPYTGGESLFLYGPSGSGKTRVGALLMKRALLAGRDIGFLWAEELKDAAQSRFDRLKLLRGFAARDVLMMDDALLTGAQDEKITDFLRDLIDLLMRNGNKFIITSQVGEADYAEAADKFGKATKTDKERIAAIFRRIRERCKIIPFVQAKPAAGEVAF